MLFRQPPGSAFPGALERTDTQDLWIPARADAPESHQSQSILLPPGLREISRTLMSPPSIGTQPIFSLKA